MADLIVDASQHYPEPGLVVDAPRDLVWQAFTEPEHLAAFWGGPGITVPVESVAMDFCLGAASS